MSSKVDFFRNFLLLVTSNVDSESNSQSQSSNKQQNSVIALDLYGNLLHHESAGGVTFKSCIAEKNCVCALSSSTYSASGSSFSNRQDGDFLIVAQPSKPQINIYEWGRSQVHLQCHTQEVITAVASDLLGHFLFAGSRKGFVYVWNILDGQLIFAAQIHYQQVSKLHVTKDSQLLISASEDGTLKAWQLPRLLDSQQASARVVTPHRSWAEHTSAVRDFLVIESNTLRVLSCSFDHHLILYDVHRAAVVLKVTLTQPLECVTSNFSLDVVVTGSSLGLLSFCDFSLLSSQTRHVSPFDILPAEHDQKRIDETNSAGMTHLSAHSKKVTVLLTLPDNATLLSASDDGKLKFWNLHSQQLLREIDCFHGLPVTNCQLFARPHHLLLSGLSKQGLFPIPPLKKYADADANHSAKDERVTIGPTNLSVSLPVTPHHPYR
eukprot:gene5911-6353_t